MPRGKHTGRPERPDRHPCRGIGGGAVDAHVIDRRGRHAGIFHGANLGPVNMVLYLNGLTNAPPPDPGVWDRVLGVFQMSRQTGGG